MLETSGVLVISIEKDEIEVSIQCSYGSLNYYMDAADALETAERLTELATALKIRLETEKAGSGEPA